MLDRTGWSRDRNSKCLLLSVCCSLEIKPSPEKHSCHLTVLLCYKSSWHHPSQTPHCLPPVWERRCIITGAICATLLHWAWTRTRKSRHHGKIQQTALHSAKDPSIPPPQVFVKFGMDSTDAATSPRASCPDSLTHGAFKICHHKYFQLLLMMPQDTG